MIGRTGNALISIVPSLLLFTLAGLLFFTRLSAPLLEPEEARYAEIPRQMLVERSFIVPVLNGQPYYHKPPLVYWLVIGCYQIFGVHDWAARLIPGSAGVLIVMLLYWWGRRPLGRRAAFTSAVILCLSARFIYLGRMLTLDIVLCLCVVAALLAAFRAVGGEKGVGSLFSREKTPDPFFGGWWLVSACACGLGLLTKGPVALVLVVVPVMLFQLLHPIVARPRFWAWLLYIGCAFAIALPWYASMAVYNWQGFVDFFWVHHVLRFVDPIDHAKPFWFYLPSLLLGTLPWSLALIPLVRSIVDGIRRSRFRQKAGAPSSRLLAKAATERFFLLSFAWCVFFFSCSGCKRAVYILPALPLLALALGCYLARALDWQPVRWRGHWLFSVPAGQRRFALAVTLCALSAGIAGAVVVVHAGFWQSHEALFIAALLAGALAVVIYYASRLTAAGAWCCCIGILFLLNWGSVYHLLPDYNRRFSMRGYVRPYAELIESEDLPIICYPRHWDSIGFYTRRHDTVQHFSTEELPQLRIALKGMPAALVFIRRDGSLHRFLNVLPPHLEFVPHFRQRQKVIVGIVRLRSNLNATALAHRRRN